MSVQIAELRMMLEEDDIAGFLSRLETFPPTFRSSPEITLITQTLLPPRLLTWLNGKNEPECLARLSRLIAAGTLLVIDEEVLDALQTKNPKLAVPKFADSEDQKFNNANYASKGGRLVGMRSEPKLPSVMTEMRRVIIHSTFLVSSTRVGDLICAKQNLCRSSQEREFLKAIRLFMPNVSAYPNVPLGNFMDLKQLRPSLSKIQRGFASRGLVDVLLCTVEEDPIAGFELDSDLHDSDEARYRDQIKNQLFLLAGLPLIRIRCLDVSNARAEDFYELLKKENDIVERIRPGSLNARRSHDILTPV